MAIRMHSQAPHDGRDVGRLTGSSGGQWEQITETAAVAVGVVRGQPRSSPGS
jgi:hypothetical protein